MRPNRRRFLSLLGVGAASAPLAAKAISDAEIAKLVGANNAFSSAGLGLGGGYGVPATDDAVSIMKGTYIEHHQRVINAADYIKMFGIPEVLEFELRDAAKYIHSFDPDIACKKTWSMFVKIQHQRQRNYERAVERIHKSGWHQRGRQAVKKILGFEWPL